MDVRPPSTPTSPVHSRVAYDEFTRSSVDSSPSALDFEPDDFSPHPSPFSVASLARERNRLTLRGYLHHLLATPQVASSETLRSFLLANPTAITAREAEDVLLREDMDRMREQEILQFREEVDGRVKELEKYLRRFKEDLVKEGEAVSCLVHPLSLGHLLTTTGGRRWQMVCLESLRLSERRKEWKICRSSTAS
jgi:hypothetical protein